MKLSYILNQFYKIMLSIHKRINDELFLNLINRFELQSLLMLWRMEATRKAESEIIASISIISHPELHRDRMDTGSSGSWYITKERGGGGEKKDEDRPGGKEELHSGDFLGQTN